MLIQPLLFSFNSRYVFPFECLPNQTMLFFLVEFDPWDMAKLYSRKIYASEHLKIGVLYKYTSSRV